MVSPAVRFGRLKQAKLTLLTFKAGYLKEWAFTPLDIIQDDPIFEGLGPAPVVLEVHYWEIKETPPGFDVLASTDVCRIQMMKHKEKQIYSTQFHPEAYHDGKADLPNHLVKLVYPEGVARSA